jgi:hypothetical protein
MNDFHHLKTQLIDQLLFIVVLELEEREHTVKRFANKRTNPLCSYYQFSVVTIYSVFQEESKPPTNHQHDEYTARFERKTTWYGEPL